MKSCNIAHFVSFSSGLSGTEFPTLVSAKINDFGGQEKYKNTEVC
jgi:hypothetical protein